MRILVKLGIVLAAVTPIESAGADRPENADPALAPWFESLKQPGSGVPCCSIADCRATEVRQDLDGYEVLIDQRWKLSSSFWLRVPKSRIIDQIDNPTGVAVVCFTPAAGILCFVRPPDS